MSKDIYWTVSVCVAVVGACAACWRCASTGVWWDYEDGPPIVGWLAVAGFVALLWPAGVPAAAVGIYVTRQRQRREEEKRRERETEAELRKAGLA